MLETGGSGDERRTRMCQQRLEKEGTRMARRRISAANSPALEEKAGSAALAAHSLSRSLSQLKTDRTTNSQTPAPASAAQECAESGVGTNANVPTTPTRSRAETSPSGSPCGSSSRNERSAALSSSADVSNATDCDWCLSDELIEGIDQFLA